MCVCGGLTTGEYSGTLKKKKKTLGLEVNDHKTCERWHATHI